MDLLLLEKTLLGLFIAVIVAITISKLRGKRFKLPPGPIPVPVFGNWLQVGDDLNHRNLTDLAKKFGDIFLLRMGQRNLVVVSSPDLAKEVLHTQGVEFGSRTRNVVFDIFTGEGQDMVFTVYGEHWRKMRRIMTVPFFTNKVVQQYRHGWESEAAAVVEDVKKYPGSATNGMVLRRRLQLMMYNNMYRIMFDRRFESEEDPLFMKLKGLNGERSRLAQSFDYNYGDFIPILRPFLRGYLKICKEVKEKRIRLFKDYFVDERKKLSSTKTTTNEGLKCAIDHILDAQQKGEINEDNVLYIVENINVAGKWGPHFPSLLIFTTATQCHAFYCFTQFFREVIMGNANGASLKISTPNPSDHPAASPSPSSPQKTQDLKQAHHHEEDIPSSSSSSSIPPPPPANEEEKAEQWGTHVMGHPAVPTCHPDNKKAALWGAAGTEQAQSFHHPYLQYKPIEKSNNSPMESMLHVFNSWSNRAESMANNIWHNLKTGTSVSGAAWGKMNVTAKAITGGGFEALYKQSFATYPNEKLNKSFACYLSTSTGPVAGTLYLSNLHTAFCSDRPLSFTAPSGQVTWSYYKIMVPLGNIATINPVVMRENSTEKYIQIVTIDGHDFWFMGFVNYEKASRHLTQSISTFVASGIAVNPAVAVADEKPDKADY